jgi:hypothetical protein
MTNGVSLKSEGAGQFLVLDAHLTSLNMSFETADEAIHSFVDDGWYGIFSAIPFITPRAIPQGIVSKTGGKWRRTSDGGSPRKTTIPPVLSINAASKLASWSKEVKPTLAELASDMAILLHAATLFGDDTYILVDDFKIFFNQFRLHPSEWWKSTFLWTNQGSPAWVVEYVLGFGMGPSSNIAQRFADAIMDLLFQRFDAIEDTLFAAESDPSRRAAWLDQRTQLGPNQ